MTPDVAIVGGGPSGLALAGMLEKVGLSYIVYERSARDTPPRGGCLDLHANSGQRAMKAAGCFDEFKKYARGGDAAIHQAWDHKGNKVFAWGHEDDSPELDRDQIKKALLTAIPEEKVVWRKGVTSADRDENGQIVLSFGDGTSATGFKLVVGADGTWSKIRHLVTPSKPKYAEVFFLTFEIHASNPHYPAVEKIAGHGPMVVCGRSTMIWNQRQGDSHYKIYLMLLKPEDFATNGPVDVADTEAVKKLMLQDEYFGGHFADVKALIETLEGPVYPWPLYYMPPESLSWESAPGVTLIGDAAHTTTPFAGDGVNCAMLDSIMLSEKLKEFGISRVQEAIGEYEKKMFPYAADVIRRSNVNGELFFDWNAPYTLRDAGTLSAGGRTKLSENL